MFKDYEMTLYGALGVLFALSVLVAVLDKKYLTDILFSCFCYFGYTFFCNRGYCRIDDAVAALKVLYVILSFFQPFGVSFKAFSVFKQSLVLFKQNGVEFMNFCVQIPKN